MPLLNEFWQRGVESLLASSAWLGEARGECWSESLAEMSSELADGAVFAQYFGLRVAGLAAESVLRLLSEVKMMPDVRWAWVRGAERAELQRVRQVSVPGGRRLPTADAR